MVPVHLQKEKIISLIKLNGPLLPVQIARSIGVSLLFAGAFLSEMYGEKKIKMSSMRIGSSPLYYIEGQEKLLENFYDNLNIREKEAFFALKNSGFLEDDAITPVLRVALREIKDFAVPMKIRLGEEDIIFWRYYMLGEEDVRNKIQNKHIDKLIEAKIPERTIDVGEGLKNLPLQNIEANAQIDSKEKITGSLSVKEKVKKKPFKKETKSKNIENPFPRKIKEYLAAKDIELLELILEKKKEFIGKIRANMLFGKQEFYLIAKDKKNLNENDLAIALQNAQSARMPAFVLSNGGLNKKGEEYLKEWRNLIKFEKVKI